MTAAARFRAWRFLNPGLDPAGVPGGLGVAPTGGIAMVDEDESVRQAILLLLSTIPGERVMRPRYGSYLHRLVFAPNDQTTAGLAIHYVRQAIERWEPRVEILSIDANPHPEAPERLVVQLDYLVRASQLTGVLTYLLDLSGGRVEPAEAADAAIAAAVVAPEEPVTS
ncbi:MAG: GPW/gp25 family protein [Acidimicrobiales bacterium]